MTTRDRLSLLAAAAVALASSALTPVFHDLGWLPAVLGAVVAVASASAVARLTLAPRAVQGLAGLLGLGAYVTLTFAGSTLLHGVLPTPTTIAFLWTSFTGGLADVSSLAAPVPTTSRLVLLAVLGTGAIAVAVDLLAVVLRKVALSGLPLLLLFAVPSAVLRGELGVLPFLLGAAGWLGLLLADSSDEVARWGTPLRGAGASARPGARRAGRRIGVAALGVAAVAPALVPGLDGRLLAGSVPGTVGVGTTVTYDPMTQLDGWLRDQARRRLLTYRSPAGPVPLRLTTLDVYDVDAGTFTSSGNTADDDEVQDGVPTPEDRTAPTDAFTVAVELTGRLGGSLLPVPATPTDVDVDGAWSWDTRTETVFSERTSLLDVRASYEVRAASVRADATLLRRGQHVPSEVDERYAQDPELSAYAQELLDRTTAGLRNDFDRVVAVQRLFRETGFVYTGSERPRHPGSPDLLTSFLQDRRGACQQYSVAMAALVRGLGIPARVAVGFTGGSPVGSDRYEVSTREGHAWPEVWFEGAGWVRFEPTPRDDDVSTDPPEYSLEPPLQEAETDLTLPSAAAAAPAPAEGADPDQADRAADDASGTAGVAARAGGLPLVAGGARPRRAARAPGGAGCVTAAPGLALPRRARRLALRAGRRRRRRAPLAPRRLSTYRCCAPAARPSRAGRRRAGPRPARCRRRALPLRPCGPSRRPRAAAPRRRHGADGPADRRHARAALAGPPAPPVDPGVDEQQVRGAADRPAPSPPRGPVCDRAAAAPPAWARAPPSRLSRPRRRWSAARAPQVVDPVSRGAFACRTAHSIAWSATASQPGSAHVQWERPGSSWNSVRAAERA